LLEPGSWLPSARRLLDEVYVRTPEERAAGDKPDNSIHPGREFTMGNNVLNDRANWEEAIQNLSSKETFSVRRERMLNNIRDLHASAEGSISPEEKLDFDMGLDMETMALIKLNAEQEETIEKEAEDTDVDLV
jgi:hypothetical protein